MGRRVNVAATEALVRAAEVQPRRPRFVHASSGSLRPAQSPSPARQAHGRHFLAAVRDLRHPEARSRGARAVLGPRVGIAAHWRRHVRRFGRHALRRRYPVLRRRFRDRPTLPHGGQAGRRLGFRGGRDRRRRWRDPVDRRRRHALATARRAHESMAATRGLVGLPLGRRGDPDDDDAWYPYGDWMDVTRAQRALSFHHHSSQMLDEMRAHTGWRYYPTRLVAPWARLALKRRVYSNASGRYADVWGRSEPDSVNPRSSPDQLFVKHDFCAKSGPRRGGTARHAVDALAGPKLLTCACRDAMASRQRC
jgi:hypothetical protein